MCSPCRSNHESDYDFLLSPSSFVNTVQTSQLWSESVIIALPPRWEWVKEVQNVVRLSTDSALSCARCSHGSSAMLEPMRSDTVATMWPPHWRFHVTTHRLRYLVLVSLRRSAEDSLKWSRMKAILSFNSANCILHFIQPFAMCGVTKLFCLFVCMNKLHWRCTTGIYIGKIRVMSEQSIKTNGLDTNTFYMTHQ